MNRPDRAPTVVSSRARSGELLVHKGDRVRRGQGIIKWNPAAVEEAGKSPITAVVALGTTADQLSGVVESGRIEAGDALFTWN